MKKYYTRVCNFYYGNASRKLVKEKKKLSKFFKKKINKDINIIIKKNKNFSNFNFKNIPNIMGILNLTPDSFSDGGKFNKKSLAFRQATLLYKNGANIVDVGGESTRPGSKIVKSTIEWNRIFPTIKKFSKKIALSLDTRKSEIMEKGIRIGVKLINDVSGLKYDKKTISVLKKYKTPFVIHHIQGTPATMQVNPKYKNVLFDIYDFFEERIKYVRIHGIKHNNIIIDPGIGFGKNLKHNMKLISNISIFHSLGFPILLGVSRKRFIKDISGINDNEQRLGGTVSATLFSMMQGVQILRAHDVNDIIQSIKVFKKLIKS